MEGGELRRGKSIRRKLATLNRCYHKGRKALELVEGEIMAFNGGGNISVVVNGRRKGYPTKSHDQVEQQNTNAERRESEDYSPATKGSH